VAEDREDRSACGTPTRRAYGVREFQNLPGTPDMQQGWVRDWSWRRWDQISLTQLQGNSSLAAAAYATLFDVKTIDSGRWGAGLPETYGNMSSFEAVHGFCVGAMLQLSPRVNRGHSRSYYGERAKFDFVLDVETSTSALIADEILASINGWRKVEDGRLCVGVERRGHLPVWHFADEQTESRGNGLAFDDAAAPDAMSRAPRAGALRPADRRARLAPAPRRTRPRRAVPCRARADDRGPGGVPGTDPWRPREQKLEVYTRILRGNC
jgi:hypothetical protein